MILGLGTYSPTVLTKHGLLHGVVLLYSLSLAKLNEYVRNFLVI